MEYATKDNKIQKVKHSLYYKKWKEEGKLYKIFNAELCFYEGILLNDIQFVLASLLCGNMLSAFQEVYPGIVARKARLRARVRWWKCENDTEN